MSLCLAVCAVLTHFPPAYKVFFSSQGKQGLLGLASKQQLENLFGTSRDVDVAEQLLARGVSRAGEGFSSDRIVGNLARGDMRMDNKGSGAKLSGA